MEQALPDWFWRARLGQPVVGDAARRSALKAGLAALAAHWRIGSGGYVAGDAVAGRKDRRSGGR